MERGMLLSLMATLALVACSMISTVDGAVVLPRESLTRHYYKKTNTCDDVERFVKHQVTLFWQKDKSVTAKFLRLLYSDCMVNGCDGSILLEGANSEKTAPQNLGLGTRIFEIVDKIKTVLEAYCPRAVSCADILQLATRDAVNLAGGPSYIVLTGRKDGPSSEASTVDLPYSPDITWEESLQYFETRGLDVQDMTTLLGAHTMGKAGCQYIRGRLYNYQGTKKPDPSLNSEKLAELRKQCPEKVTNSKTDGMVYLNDDSGDKYRFTNSYYTNILSNKAVLGIDQQLAYGNDTMQLTQEFANPSNGGGFKDFKKAFALSINRMGAYKVLTGKSGEVRRHCRFTNSNNPYIKH